jgi:hypothetical protein
VTLSLPALDGRSPLGFLAALGALDLLSEHTDRTPRLAWSATDCTALLDSGHQTLDELVTDLQKIADAVPEDGVLPGLPIDLPPPGAAPDPLRLPRARLRELAEDTYERCGSAGERWLASLVTDLALDERGRAGTSLFTAPAGRQSMRTMLEKPLADLRGRPTALREALTGWRRCPDVTGEYLDHRAVFDAVDAPDGKPRMRGVPAATWLALMAFPLLRTTAVAGTRVSSGWQTTPARPGGKRPKQNPRLVYPLWSTPVDPHGVVALLEHPVLQGAEPGPAQPPAPALSIFWVCAAERRPLPGGKSAGVLTPVAPSRPAAERPAPGIPGSGRTSRGRRGSGRNR